MGHDVEQFEENVDDELICPICSCVLDEPLLVERCEHTFCAECIKKWLKQSSSCPVDRNPITVSALRPVPRITRNMLGRLSVRCNNYAHGCHLPLRLEELRTHLMICEYDPKRPVLCVKGCGLPVPKDEQDTHNCVRIVAKAVTEQKKLLSIVREEVKTQGTILGELKLEISEITSCMHALRVLNPTLRVWLERNERDELLIWSRSLSRTRVSRWCRLVPNPDEICKVNIRAALIASRCPRRVMQELVLNCHANRWPAGLACEMARQMNAELFDDYICRRLPTFPAIVVLSVDNGHMSEDMIKEPGIVLYFLNGFN